MPCKREDIALLGKGFGISRTTAYRHHGEGVAVLAEQAPDGFPLGIADVANWHRTTP